MNTKSLAKSTIIKSYMKNATCDDDSKDLGANISGGIMDTMCAMCGGMEELTCVLPSDIFTSTLVTVLCPSVNTVMHKYHMDKCHLSAEYQTQIHHYFRQCIITPCCEYRRHCHNMRFLQTS